MEQGIVIYTDGGCRPSRGFGGWGIHGFLFNHEVPTKGTGLASQVLTKRGYIPKSDYDAIILSGKEFPQVTPIHYIDGYGSYGEVVTNNIAEMCAAINALRHVSNYDVKTALLFLDSEYVLLGLDGRVDKWKKNNWLRHDGTPPANVSYWKELLELRDIVKNRGVALEFKWVKGHSGVFGNEQADKLATVGVMASRNLEVINSMEVSVAAAYWKYDAEKHPFIQHRRMYFNTIGENLIPGEYYLGEHGKEDDLLGKRISDGAFSVVKLAEPDYALETLRNHQCAIARGNDCIIMALVDKLFSPNIHQEVSNYGRNAFVQKDAWRIDLFCLDEEPLTRHLNPPKLAMRAVDSLNALALTLDDYIALKPNIVCTDITDILYETAVVKGKGKEGKETTTMKLKAEYNVGFAALTTDINYESSVGVSKAPVTLTLNIDLLGRNALKRLESTIPKVTVISWLEAPGIFRYATVIESAGDIGIWCGVYSNLRIITAETTKTEKKSKKIKISNTDTPTPQAAEWVDVLEKLILQQVA
jgi:ribonuclease HI